MTDIELRQQGAIVPDQVVAATTDLEYWARQYVAAAQFAAGVCSTLMVPAAYHKKPEEAAAAILAGAELGFSPMKSLNAFDNIKGTPAPKALTLRAVVQSHGHRLDIIESDEHHAIAEGQRKGETRVHTVRWDLERATRAGYVAQNKKYQTEPEAMFVARATAELARRIAADAIMGVPYAAEEIADQPALAPSPIAAMRRLTVADLDEPPAVEAAEPRTEDQRKRMFALWGELGYSTDKDRPTRLDLTSQFIGRKVESSNELTADEAAVVIARLQARIAEVKQPGGDA